MSLNPISMEGVRQMSREVYLVSSKGAPGCAKQKCWEETTLCTVISSLKLSTVTGLRLELPILKNSEIFFFGPGLCHWSSSKVLSIEESKKPASESQRRIIVCRASRALNFTDLKNLKYGKPPHINYSCNMIVEFPRTAIVQRRLCILVPGDLLVFES